MQIEKRLVLYDLQVVAVQVEMLQIERPKDGRPPQNRQSVVRQSQIDQLLVGIEGQIFNPLNFIVGKINLFQVAQSREVPARYVSDFVSRQIQGDD